LQAQPWGLQAIPIPSQIKPKKPVFEGRRGRGRFGFFRSTLGLSYNLNPPLFTFCLLNGFVFGVFVHHVHRPKKGASAHRPGIEIDLELGEGPHGLRDMGHETTREIKCAREQERKRSDGSGYTATSTATLRSPLKQQIKQFSWHSAHFFSCLRRCFFSLSLSLTTRPLWQHAQQQQHPMAAASAAAAVVG
jgi:hypothetical protein